MHESVRQEYLNAMGVESYYPRFQLEAAPEIIRCEDLEVEYSEVLGGSDTTVSQESAVAVPPLVGKAEVAPSKAPELSQETERVKGSLTSNIFDERKARAETAVVESAKQLVSDVSERTATFVTPTFQHRIVSGSALLLIDSVAADSEQQRRLLRNLSLAVRRNGKANFQEDLFTWPDSSLPKGAVANSDAATEAFTHCVLGKAARADATLCILFGETEFLSQQELTDELPLIHAGSLESLLTRPKEKRALWQDIHSMLEAQGAKAQS